MNSQEKQAIRALEQKVRELEQVMQRGAAEKGSAQIRETERSPYVLSATDKALSDATRLRAQGFTQATGPRPIGGGTAGIGDINASATVGLSKDTLARAQSSGTGLPNGYGPEAFNICESGTIVSRNFITDNPD